MAESSSTSDNDETLRQLVALSSSLHSTLTLQQLVPIHEALIRAVAPTTSEEQSLAIIEVALGADDDSYYRSILAEGEPALQLLVIQFLLHPVSGLSRLTNVLIPLLLHFSDDDTSSSTTPAVASNEELREALLDAVFQETASFAAHEVVIHDSMLTGLSHAWVCRILVRLHTTCSTDGGATSSAASMDDLIAKHILDSISASTSIDTLRPVTVWLLPLLYKNEQAMQQIWTKCMELVREVVVSEQQEDESNTNTAMIASAVLCTIVPHLLETELPSGEGSDKKLALHQPLVWDFLSYLLHRGAKVVVKGGGFRFGKSAAMYQILRRRGLYLMGLIAPPSSVWTKYVMCFETLEMEQEQHLMDQVWDAVTELCVEASSTTATQTVPDATLPPITWDWISAMLCRLFLSDTPVLRKLVMYRFLNGQVGVEIEPQPEPTPLTEEERKAVFKKQAKKKNSVKSKRKNAKVERAPLSLMSTDFILDVILPSFDTLGASIGTNMQFEHNGKIETQEMTPKLVELLMNYVSCVSEERLEELLTGVLSPHVMCRLRPRTVVLLLTAVSDAVVTRRFPITQEALATAIDSFNQLFISGSIVITFRRRLLSSFATILASSNAKAQLDPKTTLRILSLFPLDLAEEENARTDHPTYKSLQQWINLSPRAADTAAACATAFVQFQLLPSLGEKWDPMEASSDLERSMGAAIALMATLASDMASSLLWPAVHKGLSTCPTPTVAWLNADKASRALILLENGCRLEVLSGMGNGDLVLDQATNQMMPPPPTIEVVLANSVGFMLNHIRALASLRKQSGSANTGSTRSGNTNRISASFAHVIGQLKVLSKSYPSSMSVSSGSEEMLESSIKAVMLLKDEDSIDAVTFTSLSYAALSSGANPWLQLDGISTADVCAKLLRLDFIGTGKAMSKPNEQTARSIFHYARWGCLSIMLPTLLKRADAADLTSLLENVFSRALELVEATPSDALLPLFDSVRTAGSSWLSITGDVDSYASHLSNIINAMFAAMSDTSSSANATYMLNEICGLIFRPAVLFDEYQRLQENSDYEAPIRESFLKLVKMAGTNRSYILRAVLCHICAGWLGSDGEISPGLSAIPYVKEFVKLLVHKEEKLDESSTNQSQLAGSKQASETALTLPPGTNYSSFARGFLLVFLGRLPDPSDGLNPTVLSDFLHPVILTLLNDVCFSKLKAGNALMTGTEDYSLRLRNWQALCILSRFVTEDIAEEVSDRVYETLNQNLHGQIRYFIEIFAIQCARMHPAVFVARFVKEIVRIDLSLQQVSSLMVVGGNLIVGRYTLDFFSQFEVGDTKNLTLHQVLSGVIPWLSSTQGFSRAIAQLLVHGLIPLAIDVSSEDGDNAGNDWYLRNLYFFLDKNPEMKRLRKKQLKVFDRYDADYICTVQGLLSLKVDEGDEANPVHVIDVIKKCLADVYLDAHEHGAPLWKQIEEMLLAEPDGGDKVPGTESDALVNFQRKIIPLDALNLAVDESREKRLRNASGRKRQSLVICASLVDKIPNLAGLARTAEIFAADRLVIPDKNVVRMDNFKSISVGAGDWVEIEECNEENLLAWLGKKQEEGYTIVGLEQTSSSTSIENYQFPEKTVLLLGKEKEGIPVEFLQLVDQCVEIPQLGIIRSLNVHVSGAICIWEYSKQLLSRSTEAAP